ncbi:hypothetical protein B0A50_05566 [Salinomyces thailandicus]|uniref:Uncharacterized protein n=1 Tax=Salinomyces thailandicus TaxID=706561 RepID=A0A4U0TU25_9PEZI|nr:hypothetical protein B0A50_05566 [Salinomyces thailandica]
MESAALAGLKAVVAGVQKQLHEASERFDYVATVLKDLQPSSSEAEIARLTERLERVEKETAELKSMMAAQGAAGTSQDPVQATGRQNAALQLPLVPSTRSLPDLLGTSAPSSSYGPLEPNALPHNGTLPSPDDIENLQNWVNAPVPELPPAPSAPRLYIEHPVWDGVREWDNEWVDETFPHLRLDSSDAPILSASQSVLHREGDLLEQDKAVRETPTLGPTIDSKRSTSVAAGRPKGITYPPIKPLITGASKPAPKWKVGSHEDRILTSASTYIKDWTMVEWRNFARKFRSYDAVTWKRCWEELYKLRFEEYEVKAGRKAEEANEAVKEEVPGKEIDGANGTVDSKGWSRAPTPAPVTTVEFQTVGSKTYGIIEVKALQNVYEKCESEEKGYIFARLQGPGYRTAVIRNIPPEMSLSEVLEKRTGGEVVRAFFIPTSKMNLEPMMLGNTAIVTLEK